MKLRGKGIACFFYGMGNTGKPNPSSAYVELMQDGSANVFCGVADIGQGSCTTMSQIAAQELGIPFEMVTFTCADTGVTPEAGSNFCLPTVPLFPAMQCFWHARMQRSNYLKRLPPCCRLGLKDWLLKMVIFM